MRRIARDTMCIRGRGALRTVRPGTWVFALWLRQVTVSDGRESASDGTQADHALTFKLDHTDGADQVSVLNSPTMTV